MNLSDISIRRPVLAIVCSLVHRALRRASSFFFLGVREYPAVDPPIVTVARQLRRRQPGGDRRRRSPSRSSSRSTASTASACCPRRRARSAARSASSSRSAPTSRPPPTTCATGLAARSASCRPTPIRRWSRRPTPTREPILFVSVQSPTRSILEVNDFADRVLRERVQTIPGVSAVRIFGEKRYAMRLWLDPVRLAAHGLTPLDVQQRARRAERRPAERPPRGQRRRAQPAHRRPPHHARGVRRDDPQGARTGGRSSCATSAAPSSAPRTCAPATRATAVPVIGVAVIAAAEHQRHRHRRRVLPAPRRHPARRAARLPRSRSATTSPRFVRRSIREVEETIFIAFGAGGADHLRVPAQLALDADPGARHPGEHRRGVLRHVPGRLHDQRADAGRASCSRSAWSCDDAIVVLENIYAKIERGQRAARGRARRARARSTSR